MVVYKLTNKLNGKCYIGQTISTLEKRWKKHCASHGISAISLAINKYGSDAFSRQIIHTYDNLETLNHAEEYFIDFYNSLSPNGYNLHTGGLNHRPSDETRLKQSISHKGKDHAGTFKKGVPHSEDMKLKLSAAKKGKIPWNKGLKGKQKAWNKGLPQTESAKLRFKETLRSKQGGW